MILTLDFLGLKSIHESSDIQSSVGTDFCLKFRGSNLIIRFDFKLFDRLVVWL